MNKKLEQVQKEALALCAPVFHEMEEISLYNTEKVLSAFRKHHLSAYHFAPSNGYGYGDPGREKLEEIWCDVFHGYGPPGPSGTGRYHGFRSRCSL